MFFAHFYETEKQEECGFSLPTTYTGVEMDSCPVCYVAFSTTQAEDVARKLPCEHVACTQCLEDCFEEATERGDKTSPPVSFTAVLSAVCQHSSQYNKQSERRKSMK